MKDKKKPYWNYKNVATRKGEVIDIIISRNTPKEESDDTKNRKAIQEDIIKMIKEGKGRIETFDYLWNKYKDTKLCMYISQWYEHHYARLKQKDKCDDEGR